VFKLSEIEFNRQKSQLLIDSDWQALFNICESSCFVALDRYMLQNRCRL